MKVGRYIYSKLTADSGVSALVATRVYPVLMPQNAAYPAIVYNVAKAPLDRGKDCDGVYMTATVQITAWAEWIDGQNAYDKLDAIEAAILAALDYTSGTAVALLYHSQSL